MMQAIHPAALLIMLKPNPANASIARRLVQARAAAGLATASAAAIRLAVHPQTYGYHEQGVTSIKAADLRRYAEAFGVSHGWLTTGIGSGPAKAMNRLNEPKPIEG